MIGPSRFARFTGPVAGVGRAASFCLMAGFEPGICSNSDLIRFRLAHPGLRTHSIDVLHVHNVNRVIAFRRWGDGEDFLVLASLRNAPFSDGYVVENGRLPNGQWQEVFSSDAAIYGGNNTGNLGATIPSANRRFAAVIPANAVVVFRKL